MADHEKLTETVGVKLSERRLKQIRAVAESHGLEASSWIRLLIDEALSREAERYRALHLIFGDEATETNNNVVQR